MKGIFCAGGFAVTSHTQIAVPPGAGAALGTQSPFPDTSEKTPLATLSTAPMQVSLVA